MTTHTRTTNFNKLLFGTAIASIAMSSPAQADPWSSFTDEHGSISIDTSVSNHTNITQSGNLYIGTSTNLNITAAQSVTINQDNTSSLFVGKSDNGVDPTRILGTLRTRLTSNASQTGGSVAIFDPNGVIFGANSMVDTGGIIASTGELDNNRLINDGVMEIDNFGDGRVVNNGTMTIANGGLAAFVSPTVVNNGVITATLGRVQLAGTNTKTTVDLYGDGLVEFVIDEENEEALRSVNRGEIYASEGTIQMTAGAAKNVVDSIVNMDGIARVDSVSQVGGKIVLGGSSTGRVVIQDKVQARGGAGGGEITVTAKEINMRDDGVVNARAFDDGNGGTITMNASDSMILDGRIRAMGGDNSGDGGTIFTSAVNTLRIREDLEVDASAANGTNGSWVIDPIDFSINAIVASVFQSTLNTGTNVGAAATNNVTVDALMSWTGSGALALNAGNDVIFNADVDGAGDFTVDAGRHIDVTGGNTVAITGGNLDFNAGSDVFVRNGAEVSVTNGNLEIASANANGGISAIEIDGTLRSDNGDITLESTNYFIEINSTGEVFQTNGTFTALSNHGFDIDAGATVDLGTADVSIQAPDVRLGADINTTGNITGTATLVAVENATAEIQDGVDVAANGATVNVAAGTYNESVNIDVRGLNLYGAWAETSGTDFLRGLFGNESIVTGGSPAFIVNANGVTIDGFTMDGPTLTYGVYIDDQYNTSIVNNIIKNSSEAGIGGVIDHDPTVRMTLIDNNKIDHTNTGDGIDLEGDNAGRAGGNAILSHDLQITNNQIGSLIFGGVGGNGIKLSTLGDYDGSLEADGVNSTVASVNIDDNNIYADDDGIEFSGNVKATITINDNNIGADDEGIQFDDGDIKDSTITISDNNIYADDDAIALYGALRRSSLSIIDNGLISGGDDGLDIDFVNNSDITIADNGFIRGRGSDGIEFDGTIRRSDVTIEDNFSIRGNDDAIDFENINNSDVTISGSTFITGDNGNAIELDGSVTNGSEINIAGNTAITGGDHGIVFEDEVDDSEVNIVENGSIRGRDGDGIKFGDTIRRSDILIKDNFSVRGSEDGFDFEDIRRSSLKIVGTDFITADDGNGIEFDGVINNSDIVVKNNDLILASENGISVEDDVKGNGKFLVKTNVIAAAENAILVSGDLSNDNGSGQDFRITDNVLLGAGNGIKFTGTMSGPNHSTKIDRNRATLAFGNAIMHTGAIADGAEFKINKNDIVGGGLNGIFIRADITGGSLVRIKENGIGALFGDSIKVINTAPSVSPFGPATLSLVPLGGSTVEVLDNTIVFSGGNGVNIANVDNVTVHGNTISNSGKNGVRVADSGYVDISNENSISNSSLNGIKVVRSDDVNIDNNTVSGSGRNGIVVHGNGGPILFGGPLSFSLPTFGGPSSVSITNNNVSNSDANGIKVTGKNDVFIGTNTVNDSGRNGIVVRGNGGGFMPPIYPMASAFIGPYGSGIYIFSNTVSDSGTNGIKVTNTDNATIDLNTVSDSGTNGIVVRGNGGGFIPPYPTISTASFIGSYGGGINIIGNNVSDSGANGIKVTNANYVDVTANIVSDSGKNGILVKGSPSYPYPVFNNLGSQSIGRSAFIGPASGTFINVVGNTVSDSGWNGIKVVQEPGSDIDVFDISPAAFFAPSTGGFVNVSGNTVSDSGRNGIVVIGSGAETVDSIPDDILTLSLSPFVFPTGLNIVGNTVFNSGANGIKATDSTVAIISENTVDNSGQSALLAERLADATISQNILNTSANGIEVDGEIDHVFLITGNTLTDNETGMLLRGGLINFTDLANPNTISGGVTAMKLMPDLGESDSLGLVANTFGNTILEGMTGNYFELSNGALFNPGTPTILDAFGVSFDGYIPLANQIAPGIIPGADRDRLEARIIDFDDNGTTGDIFVGVETLDLNDDDLFALNIFSLDPNAGLVNVTFTGLPFTSLDALNSISPAGGGNIAAALNNITPAAGGESDAFDLANIEPAAGAEEGCWETAAETQFSGPISFSFGGDVQSNLSGGAACE